MIIFYHKETGEIFGNLRGRVHDKQTIKVAMIRPSNVKCKDIGKYVVPFKKSYKTVTVNVTETRVIDRKTLKVGKVIVGKKKVKRGAGLVPDVPFIDKILSFEAGKEKIYDFKVLLDKNKKVIGFKKK